ncbi:MAG: urease accessory protein UreF [Opitutaceae bacterium]
MKPGSARIDGGAPPEKAAAAACSIAALLQASDSFYPTGSYAHSFGLEGLVQDGDVRDVGSLRIFLLEQALPALARTDLAVSMEAWQVLEPPPDWERLGELCRLAAALRGAREPREAAAAIGRQRCALAARLRGGLAVEFESRARMAGWPAPSCIAAVIEARSAGAPLEAALASQIYTACAALLAAAVKLLRLGQNAVQELLALGVAAVPNLIAAARTLTPERIGAFNPWWDIAAARHETAEYRLFIS